MIDCPVTEKKISKHILIVDDSLDQQMLLKMVLEANGYTTECTPNGKEALIVLRSGKNIPQTILLDMNMDVMGGLEFRQQQCEDPLLKDIPVIVVSGENDISAVRTQMNSYVIQKPLSISSLIEALQCHSKLH